MSEQFTSEREGQFQMILRYCATPHSSEDIADEFGWHIQTARNKIWELQRAKRIRSVAKKDSRKKLWQTAGSVTHDGQAVIVTSVKTVPLSYMYQHAANTDTPRKPFGDALAELLSYLYVRSYYTAQDQTNVLNVALRGTLDPLIEVRQVLERLVLANRFYLEVAEYLLFETPEVWQDGGAIMKLSGVMNLAELESLAREFEVYARSILNRPT